MRTAILFTANSPQIASGHLFVDSLLNPKLGNFKGDLWVLSTNLSDSAKLFLYSRGIKYFVNPLHESYTLQNWKQIALAQPEYKKLLTEPISENERLTKSFDTFKNKRMSKLIVLYWLALNQDKYDQIAICDNDLYIQKDINSLFEKCAEKDINKIYYEQEAYNSLPNTIIWKQNLCYKKIQDPEPLLQDDNEINIGFILSTPKSIKWLFEEIKFFLFSLKSDLLIKYGWQDQSVTRLLKVKYPENFAKFDNGDIVHLCNGGRHTVEETSTMSFIHKETKEKPYVIHFAANKQKYFPPASFATTVKPDDYYFFYETLYNRKKVNNLNSWEIFDFSSSFYKESTILARNQIRKKWVDFKLVSNKPTMLFCTWLKNGTHIDLYSFLQDIFNNQEYDTIVLSNVESQIKNDIVFIEKFPEIIQAEGNFIFSNFLARKLGYELPDVPKNAIDDCILAIMKEWKCSYSIALAISNIFYIYFKETILFYQPKVVGLLAFTPSHRVLKKICDSLGVKTFFIEFGVLDGTYAVDFIGSMGTSIVALDHSFNNKAIDEEDINYAQNFCERIKNGKRTRNIQKNIDETYKNLFDQIKQENKKIIFFAGSNDAHSGHTTTNDNEKNMHSPFFSGDEDILENLVHYVNKNNNVCLVYKPHPIYGSRAKIHLNEQYNAYQIDNVKIEQILNYVDVCIVNVSQTGYVSLVNHTPVVMLGKNQINNANCTYNIESREDLANKINLALEKGFTVEQQRNFISHVARLLKYHLFEFDDQAKYKTLKNIPNFVANHYNKIDNTLKIDNNEPLVSIVVPVHNSEQCLHKSINSIISQTYTNLEILCVLNDCSDSSKDILQYYAKFDNRIKIFETDKKGASVGRNIGIEKANGKYIAFLDSDDSFDSNAIEELVSNAEIINSDCIYFLFRERYQLVDKEIPLPRWFDLLSFIDIEEIHKVNKRDFFILLQYPFAWAKFYKREYILNNQLFFKEDQQVFEDNPHNVKTFLNSDKIYILNKVLYNYTHRKNSLVRKVSSDFETGLNAIQDVNDILKSNNLYLYLLPLYAKYKAHLISYAYSKIPNSCQEEFENKVKDVIDLIDIKYINNGLYDSLSLDKNYKTLSRLEEFKKGGIKRVNNNKIEELVNSNKHYLRAKLIYQYKLIKKLLLKQ